MSLRTSSSGGTLVRGSGGAAKTVELTQDTAIGWLVVKVATEAEAVAIAREVPTLGLWEGSAEVRKVETPRE